MSGSKRRLDRVHIARRVMLLLLLAPVWAARGQAIGLPALSAASKECIDCHKKQDVAIYQQWGESKHYRGNVACYECHAADKNDPDAYEHYGRFIATLVTPKDCGRCHSREAEEYMASHHSKGARILGSLDNQLAEVVEGDRRFVSAAFPQGVSAAAVSGCWQCHGSEVKVLGGGKLDPTTWPNSGIGRINPDGSEGSCNACHTRHEFSAAQARHPDTCGKCHLGPDHPQKEIYEESKHGILFFANTERMNMRSAKWVVGEDYWASATCATCHMSATRKQAVTHDVGLRISWNNRPAVSIRPEESDAKMRLPGKDVPWQVRRSNMTDVCSACHSKPWIDGFYVQYDAAIEQFNKKFAEPGLELYSLAKPLRERPDEFANDIDFTWYEIWHHQGRRARHGVSMFAPDYAHWHGTYEVAKDFYSQYIPALRSLIEAGKTAGDSEKNRQAAALEAKLQEVLGREEHKWYLGQMDPAERERRKQASEEFKKRYSSAQPGAK